MPRMNGSAARADGYNTRIINMEELKQARESRASSARNPVQERGGSRRENRVESREEARPHPEETPFWKQEDPFREGRRGGRRAPAPEPDTQDDRQDQQYDFRQPRSAAENRPPRPDARQTRQSAPNQTRRGAENQPRREDARRTRQDGARRTEARTTRDGWNQARQEPDNRTRWEFEFQLQREERRRPRQEKAQQPRRESRYQRNQDEEYQPRTGREQASQAGAGRSHAGLYTLMLLLGLVALGAVIGLKAFEIKGIDVKGNDTVTAQSIIALSGITPGENIFKADLSLARQNIQSDPLLEVLGISRILPDKIEIKVKQRKPHGAIAYLDSFVIIDENGTVLDERDSLPVGQYPLVTGIEIQPSVKGKQVVGVDGGVLRTMNQLLTALYDGKAMQFVSTISLATPDDIKMYTGEGIEIDIGGSADLAKKAQWIACTVPELRSHGYTSGVLYVTGANSPVFSGTDHAAGTQNDDGSSTTQDENGQNAGAEGGDAGNPA